MMANNNVFQKLTGTINGICFLNVVLGIGIIVVMTTTSNLGYEDVTGWIAVTGASLIFGSTGIPFKTPAMENVKPDPIVFAFFAGIGIFIVSLPLQVYLILWCLHYQKDATITNNNNNFFQVWSLLGSFDILVTTFLAFQTVQCLGYAKGPAVWASVGMVFSFVIGAIGFEETITNMVCAILGVPCLIVGVLLVISCQPSEQTKTIPDYSTLPVEDDVDDKNAHVRGDIELKVVQGKLDDNNNNNNNNNNNKPMLENIEDAITNNTSKSSLDNSNILIWGVFLGILTGLVDGSLMVPFKMTRAETTIETYQYLASFGISSLITTPTCLALYYFYVQLRRRSSNCDDEDDDDDTTKLLLSMDQMRLSMIPGIMNGILWGLANFMSVTATYHLSMRIAFPLTQTCVLFATCWGIFYFHEIDKSRETLFKLIAGLGFFMLGTVLLAESSN